MTVIEIKVKNRVAHLVGDPVIVCGNKDYTVRFDFDEDWAGYEEKTARFVFNEQYIDVPFSGNECPVPMLYNVKLLEVGAYVDGLSTTTPALIRCQRSVLCGDAEEAGGSFVDVPLTITENGVVIETPKNVRHNPITVAVPTPTLNSPVIEFNANGGYLYILDGANGNFTKEYELFLNGEKSTTFTATSLKMQDLGITETDEIGVVATGDLFNNSPMATARWSDLELGTIGLTYGEWGGTTVGNVWFDKTMSWTGIGSATGTHLKIASIADGQVVKQVAGGLYTNTTVKVLELPDTIISIAPSSFYRASLSKIVFGSSTEKIGTSALWGCHGAILDFRKAQKVPQLGGDQWHGNIPTNFPTTVPPDNLYDEWITATNWAKSASKIIKATVAEQEGIV